MGAKLGLSLEAQGNQTLWRDIPGFCRDIPGASEKVEKKRFVFNFRPLTLGPFWDIGENPFLTHLKGWKVFSRRALRQP